MKLKSLSLALMLLSLQAMAAVQESTQQGTRTSSSSQVST
ncbi:TIGR03759 family integrating conjugative element protein, partial [Escherichia coli]|nr:TIGR03759 family integrating conjugative element protein [Escherichia coli]EIY9351332.1 TIGR03759 family integrating conjugative element protein [Escherichia coli]